MNIRGPNPGDKTGLVLSGGGARGAYEVGLIAGLVDVLELTPDDPPPFQVFTGTSVGAINASFLVANAHRGDMGAQGLIDAWFCLKPPGECVWGGLVEDVKSDVHLRSETECCDADLGKHFRTALLPEDADCPNGNRRCCERWSSSYVGQ